MAHKADKDFFANKRSWSTRKDYILEYYLKPYLPKVAQLRKPILLVDCFAGPGKFDDGQPGSPLIMCDRASDFLSRPHAVDVRVRCIESHPDLYDRLKENLIPYAFAEARQGSFDEFVARIVSAARSETTFLYIDPFKPYDLSWSSLETIFDHVEDNVSIEVLLNFNAAIFARMTLAALRRDIPTPDPLVEDSDEVPMELVKSATIERLNAAVGGDWWRNKLSSNPSFSHYVSMLADGVMENLKTRFNEVCHIPVKASEHHKVPKYYLVFASRSSAALRLMNQAMLKAKHSGYVTMDMIALTELPDLVLQAGKNRITRGELISAVIRDRFCQFDEKQIRDQVYEFVNEGQMRAETEKARFNDKTLVWTV